MRRRRESGAALIMTLLVLAILVVLVVQFVSSVNIEGRIVRNAQDDATLELAARATLPILAALFRDDRKNGEPKEDIDTLADILFDPNAEEQRTFTIGEAEVTIEAEDLERRLPLAWLADESRREFTEDALRRLIERVASDAGDATGVAKAIGDRVAALQGEGGEGEAPGRGFYSLEQLLDGAAPAPAEGGGAAATPDPGSEGAPSGIDYAVLYGDPEADPPTAGIGPYVTTWPVSGMNINTLLPDVFYAVLPEKGAENEDDPPVRFEYWTQAETSGQIIEAIQDHRIDPDFQSGSGESTQGQQAGGKGASRSWTGTAFTTVDELLNEEIHENLKYLFAKPAEEGAEGGEEPAEGESFSLRQALTVNSRFYVVRVTVQLSESLQGVYRIVLHRSASDETSPLLFEEVTQ